MQDKGLIFLIAVSNKSEGKKKVYSHHVGSYKHTTQLRINQQDKGLVFLIAVSNKSEGSRPMCVWRPTRANKCKYSTSTSVHLEL